MRKISIFADESGDQGGHSKYYTLTLVFHNQDDDVEAEFAKYRSGLLARRLKDTPFHAEPLTNGHDDYMGGQNDNLDRFFEALEAHVTSCTSIPQ